MFSTQKKLSIQRWLHAGEIEVSLCRGEREREREREKKIALFLYSLVYIAFVYDVGYCKLKKTRTERFIMHENAKYPDIHVIQDGTNMLVNF